MDFNTDHKIRVRNGTESMLVEAVEAAMGVLVNELDLKDKLTLRFERMGGWGGSDAVHAGKWNSRRGLVKINLRNLYGQTLETFLIVLGHEVRHAVQSIHGIMDEVEDTQYQPNSHMYYNRSYYNRPVEKDARKYEDVYARLVMDDEWWASMYGANLSDHTNDEPATLNDLSASLVKLGFADEDHEHIKLFSKNDELFWFDMREVDCKRYTKAAFKKVWALHTDQLFTQPFVYEQREATIADLVC